MSDIVSVGTDDNAYTVDLYAVHDRIKLMVEVDHGDDDSHSTSVVLTIDRAKELATALANSIEFAEAMKSISQNAPPIDDEEIQTGVLGVPEAFDR